MTKQGELQSHEPACLILGAGYTGSRVAQLIRDAGHAVLALRRADIDFTAAGAPQQLAALAPAGCSVLHSVPSLPGGGDARLLQGLVNKASRVVYLSTTGVYGGVNLVDETTPIAPRNPREQARADTEAAVMAGPWTSLILRPAAIYGPDRGVHVAMAEGRYALMGDGSNYISRIHADDLARICAAALRSDLTGAYPVADEHPCPAREIADYCALHFQLPGPVSVSASDTPESRRNNRRVDGRAILARLGLSLLYPCYQEGLRGLPPPRDGASGSVSPLRRPETAGC
jgi:nucleoside-diphosphate-sugar epimerase